MLQRTGHLPELREDERFFLTGGNFGCQLAKTLEFATLAGVVVAASKPLRRVVAELLETHEKGKDETAALNAFGGLKTFLEFAHGLFVKRGLAFGQGAENAHFGLVRKVCDNDLSDLRRRKIYGRTNRRRGAKDAPARAASDQYLTLRPNSDAPPSSPGLRKSKSDHRSPKLFSTGVPVSATLAGALSCFTAFVCRAPGFLIACASSRIARLHSRCRSHSSLDTMP
jgi:hypothetical protein